MNTSESVGCLADSCGVGWEGGVGCLCHVE